jgi:hypothetical protein
MIEPGIERVVNAFVLTADYADVSNGKRMQRRSGLDRAAVKRASDLTM